MWRPQQGSPGWHLPTTWTLHGFSGLFYPQLWAMIWLEPLCLSIRGICASPLVLLYTCGSFPLGPQPLPAPGMWGNLGLAWVSALHTLQAHTQRSTSC